MAPPGAPVMVAGVPVHEQGPLARCFPFMDTPARRVLPGHLLRRYCILSSLQLGGSSVLRVALTACTGEEGPHPRCSPELVVLAQLQALQNQELVTATGFNMLGRHASGSAWDAHLAAFKHLLSQQHYSLLIAHNRAELGSSALPRQRHFLQEVLLWSKGSSSGSSSPGRFLWRLGMQADGCWMVRSIEAL
eukprot:gene3670-3931_t